MIVSVATFFILLGLILIFQRPITLWLVKRESTSYSIDRLSTKQIKENQRAKGNFNARGAKPVNFLDVINTQLKKETLPVIGLISYPEVGMLLPIFQGDGDTIMLHGAGTMKSGQVMGQRNYALASHHVSNVIGAAGENLLFSPLTKAKVGQKVYLTDKNQVFEYTTSQIFYVTPDKGQVFLDEGDKKEVTLITCATDDHYREVVKGKLTRVMPFDETTARWFSSKFTSYR